MPCIQTITSIDSRCDRGKGGIVEIYLANREEVTGITVTSGVVTAVTMATSAKFKTFNCNKQSASATSTGTNDDANGVFFVQTDLNLVFGKMDATKQVAFESIVKANTIAIYKDGNGAYWMIGEDNGCTASSFGAETGAAMSDRNAYTATLTAYSSNLPLSVDSDIIADLIA